MINNIVVFINTLGKEGAEIKSVELSKVLSEKYKVRLVVFYGDQIDSELLNRIDLDKITLVKLSGNKIKWILFFTMGR
ncbi:MAG: hypothetical protein RRY05_09135 [Bacteroidales bacterium]